MPSLKDEHQQFIDELSSTAIVNGYVYIGDATLDPVLNPQTIYSDRALTTPISNPQRTDSAGRTENKVWIADGPYSIKVTDAQGVQKLLELDNGPATEVTETYLVVDKGVNYTTVAGDHTNTINVTAAITISLGDAGTMAAGYQVTVKNSHTASITVDLDTASDTLDGTAAGSVSLATGAATTFTINSDEDGYLKSGNQVYYEEGTWTVNFSDESANDSATTATGYYTRVGNLVTCSINNFNNIDTTGLTAGEDVRISLPFVVGDGRGTGSVVLSGASFSGYVAAKCGTAGQQWATLTETASASAVDNITVSQFTDDIDDINAFTLTYMI